MPCPPARPPHRRSGNRERNKPIPEGQDEPNSTELPRNRRLATDSHPINMSRKELEPARTLSRQPWCKLSARRVETLSTQVLPLRPSPTGAGHPSRSHEHVIEARSEPNPFRGPRTNPIPARATGAGLGFTNHESRITNHDLQPWHRPSPWPSCSAGPLPSPQPKPPPPIVRSPSGSCARAAASSWRASSATCGT